MYDKGLKVKIKGIPYDENEYVEFPLLKNKPNKKQSTIIYGRNGSGKTSFSNAINEYKANLDYPNYSVLFTDENNNEINFDRDKLYVFSEEFIDKKVRFTSTNELDAIVLLGDEGDYEDQINDLKEKKTDYENQQLGINLLKYSDSKSNDNPTNVFNTILRVLKADGNWASRQQQINNAKRKASVTEQVVDNIIKNHSKKCSVEDFDTLLSEYLKVSDEEQIININLQYPPDDFDDKYYIELLEKKLQVVSSDEIASRILKTIEMYSESRSNEIIDQFSTDIDYCPYCFRPINIEEKNTLISKISSVLSKESDEFVYKLDKQKIREYEKIIIPAFISKGITQEYEFKVVEFNSAINNLNDEIEKKKMNLYTSMSSECLDDYQKVYKDMIELIDKINSLILQHNIAIKERRNVFRKLCDYNNYLAWKEIEPYYKDYQLKLKNKIEDTKNFNSLKDKIDSCENQINELNAKKSNIKDAGSEINKSLSFIFLDNNRLRLRLVNNHYVVYSNNKKVPLEKLSTGERNVIALCYFFCSIGEGQNRNDRYKDDYLVFIDDPISSFDHDNKIGIYSFLREKIAKFENSNFIMLTHNYEVGYNLAKIFNDIYGVGNPSGKSKHVTNYLELKNCKIVNNKFDLGQGKNQYKLLLQEIFKYANQDNSLLTDLTIGNAIRRVLEMFSSFEYNIGFERIIDKVNNSDDFTNYIHNYMFRILVNNESHETVSAYAYDDIDRFEMFSSTEKVTISKLALIMLLNINPQHINSYLNEDDIGVLHSWEAEYRQNIDSGVIGNE